MYRSLMKGSRTPSWILSRINMYSMAAYCWGVTMIRPSGAWVTAARAFFFAVVSFGPVRSLLKKATRDSLKPAFSFGPLIAACFVSPGVFTEITSAINFFRTIARSVSETGSWSRASMRSMSFSSMAG